MMARTIVGRALSLALALGLLLGSGVAAETPAISIELANNTPNEQRAKEQLEQLLKQYDLSRWIFTKKIRIDQSVRPHSHPVLTLNTRHNGKDQHVLADFLHEQIHWFVADRFGDGKKAIDDVMRLYPGAPDAMGAGGAGTQASTYLHVIVCDLEFESVKALLGAEAADAVIRESIAEAQSAGLGYYWIYQKVLDDQETLKAVIKKHKLTLPGVP